MLLLVSTVSRAPPNRAMSLRSSRTLPLWAFSMMLLGPVGANAQSRSLAQDSTLDNLRHPPGTPTTAWGALGAVHTSGTGSSVMILIPGIGFGADVWDEFAKHYEREFTVHAVTLPGFGGTPPLPMPENGSFADVPWTRSSLTAIEKLIDGAQGRKVTIVAQWGLASQMALQLALDHPEKLQGVVLVSGVLKAYYEQNPAMLTWSRDQRLQFVNGMAHRWFRTVTKRTWDDNNYMSYDYAVNPLRGLFLWRQAQAPSLPVWIRYLLEWYTFDPANDLSKLKVPVLVVQPGLDDPSFYVDPGRPYMRNLLHDSWKGAESANPLVEFVRISGARLFIQYDKPDALYDAIQRFQLRHSH